MAAELRAVAKFDTSDLDHGVEKIRNVEHIFETAFRRPRGGFRAEVALEAFIQDLTRGDVTTAIESVVTKLAGIGLIGGVAVTSLVKGVEELRKVSTATADALSELIKQGSRPLDPNAGPEQLKKQLDDINKAIDEAEKRRLAMGAKMPMPSMFGMNQAGGGSGENALEVQNALNSALDKRGQLLSMQVTSTDKILQTEHEIAKVHEDTRETITDITQKQEKGLLAATVAAREIAQSQQHELAMIAEITKQSDTKKKRADEEQALSTIKTLVERAQLSSKEILAAGGTGFAGLAIARLDLLRAAHEEDVGERERRMGHVRDAVMHFNRAEQIKANIGQLRESEKLPEYQFKNAIETASVFASMLTELRNIVGGFSKISFQNQ